MCATSKKVFREEKMIDCVNVVSSKLCIRSGEERKEVSEKTKGQFDDKLYHYIVEEKKKIKIRPVSIIFQNPKTPYKRRNHRNGVTYLEISLAPVVKKLVSLNEGEYYEFPSIEFIIERDGETVVYLRPA